MTISLGGFSGSKELSQSVNIEWALYLPYLFKYRAQMQQATLHKPQQTELYTFFIRNKFSGFIQDFSSYFVKSSLKCFLNLKTSNGNNNQD